MALELLNNSLPRDKYTKYSVFPREFYSWHSKTKLGETVSSGLRRRHRDILLSGSELWGTGGMLLRQLRTLGIDVGDSTGLREGLWLMPC